ncbi:MULTISPECIES: NACHT domain-containing protein [Streptomyces]|uniref:ATP-binding protein n=2 Tax=Streptomyces TaxID=1883 RepID=A0A2U9P7G4_STRAS|nr:NACHT domain-containing protein [Streptomyces actuosus]AWT45690.1 ATP-binding protein [Streptomyces actuosus]MBM4822321.1 NACHT domain-containing protein [Streptomyces actuosus]
MSAETAALRLGTTVARSAAQAWLGGRRREQERRMSMAELVELRVPGLPLQRRVTRQFEEIADAVLARLAPFIEREFRALDESGRRAVIDGVCDTIARADLSDAAILAADANPAEMVRRITGSVEPPVGLSETEERLYRALFAECCEYFVRIVRGLPVYEERALTELLARTTSLGTEIARILEQLPDRSLFAPEGTDRDGEFRRRYLELVSTTLDEVELFRSTSDRSAAQARLSVAYVSLRATGDDGPGRRARARSVPVPRPDMSDWEEEFGESVGLRVETALGGASRVLLRGEAGSGKTTLLRWLAVTAARGAFTGELAGWNGLTPVFVKLREYSGRPLPKPEAMLDSVAGTITGVMPRAWVERQLAAGTALLLIDGVDELLDGERRAVREWLRRLLAAYRDVRVVVTSRPAAAAADWLRREEFTALHLDRMTPPDLASFVRQWHHAVRELGEGLPCALEELPRYEQSLLNSLKDRPHLQSLAGTPLLASMLCAMHLNRGSQLPRDRMELYRSALHTLVHERDAHRNVPSAVDDGLSLKDKLVLLRDLAWRLSDNNRTEISLEQAGVFVGRKLTGMRHVDEQDGGVVLDRLRHRSGVLRSPAVGRLDFVHRTFQEYLAAEEAAEEDRIGNLVERAHLDLWRETIIMAAGHANRPQREELLGGILDRAEGEPRHARKLRLLAASCQETVPEVSQELGARLDEAVERLLPPRRETDPVALAAVGVSLLRKLPRTLSGLTEKAAARTVETVALIGGEEALALLAGYIDDTRDDVVSALIKSWRYFDADAYAHRVLSRMPLERRSPELTHPGQWRAALRLPSLKRLWISYPFEGMAALAELPSLSQLAFYSLRGEVDLSPLPRTQPELSLLALLGDESMSFRSLGALAELPQLSMLILGLNGVCDLSELRSGPKLTHLSLWDVPEGVDLGALSDCSGFDGLDIFGQQKCLPRGLDTVAALPGLALSLGNVDVATWLRSPGFVPPKVRSLSLYDCVLPEAPDALDFPGVDVHVH